MPRKKFIYTPYFPYHIVARCNNKEWFKTHLDDVWSILSDELKAVSMQFDFGIHAFLLMPNHYHLVASCSEINNLGRVMQVLQTKTSSKINLFAGRVNHVFGGRYRGSLIKNEIYFGNVIKYVFQNPIKAGLCKNVEDWKYSTLSDFLGTNESSIPTCSHLFESYIHEETSNILKWLNTGFQAEQSEKIKKGLGRSEFKLSQVKSCHRTLW
jgi:putative transposase